MVDGWKHNGTLPWTRGCMVCGEANDRGLQLRSRIQDGKVCLDYTTRETDQGWRSAVHGGLIMTLLDEVMTWAAMIDASMACVTAEMSTRNKLPVRVGQDLHVEGWVTQNRRRIVLTEGSMTDSAGNVFATATGKYMQMPGEQYQLCEDDFVVGDGAIPVGKLIQG